MNIESSRISTIFNSGESEGPARIKSNFKGTASLSESKKKKQKNPNPNDLNAWNICNPDEFEDKLPQPFRLVDKLIYKTILGKVNAEIERIDKAKLSHNYEKGVKEISATNFFDFSGVSCFANHKNNPMNSLLVGDKSGNILLLDLNKRSLTTKKEVVAERRITDISAVTIPFEDGYLTTFSVILHATQEVFIYRYKISDYKITHSFTIKCAKSVQGGVNEKTEVGEFPFKATISSDCLYISVILYNGNVEVYKIPEPIPTSNKPEEPQNYALIQQPVLKPPTANNPAGKAAATKGQDKNAPANNPTPVQPVLGEPYEIFPVKKIQLKSPEVEKDAKDALLAMLLGNEPEPVAQAEKGKDAAKDKKAPEKKGGKDAPPKEEVKAVDPLKKEYKQNPVKTFAGLKRGPDGDNSDFVEPPLYYPDIYYLQTPVVVQDTNQKQFSFEKVVDVTSDIVCVWKQTTWIDLYELEKVTVESVPIYILTSVFKPTAEVSNQGASSIASFSSRASRQSISQQNKSPPLPEIRIIPKVLQQPRNLIPQNVEATVLQPIYTYTMIYPIACSAVSKNNTFLGLGLKDGTVIIWDLVLNQQKFVLDKHLETVTVLSFFEDWRVISGSKDGTVHMYDLQDPRNNIKYQHLFQTSGNSIVEIGVSDHGIGFAIDNQRNLRAYDLFHFQKVFKVMPLDPRGKNISFMMTPMPLLNAGKEQLCILVDENDVKNKEQEEELSSTSQSWNKKKCILIYRILDNLMATFPGLANIVKKGIEKSKAMIAFSKLSTAELNNPNFEVPLLEVGQLGKKVDTKSQSGSVSRASGSRKMSSSKSPNGKYKEPSLSDLNQTYASVDKNLRKKSNLGISPPKKGTALTHANLHPEKYLTEKQSFPKIGLVVPAKNTMEKLREINSNKIMRGEKLQQYYNQVQDELNQKEELERLQKRKEMLKDTKY